MAVDGQGFLERVVQVRCEELPARRQAVPAAELRRRAAGRPPRDLAAALRGAAAGGGADADAETGEAGAAADRGGARRGERIIAEIKRRSPSVAAYRQQGDAAALARTYERAGATAISVVTDEENFGTSLRDVAAVRGAVDLPILAKDFVVDPYQLHEARAAGADAVLLIARILPGRKLGELLGAAEDVGLCALVECHDEEDCERAVAAGAAMVGVNSRDLSTLEVTLDTTRRLLAALPDGVLKVAESGIGTRGDVVLLHAAGADAFLVGGALLDAASPAAVLRELRGVPARGRRRGGRP